MDIPIILEGMASRPPSAEEVIENRCWREEDMENRKLRETIRKQMLKKFLYTQSKERESEDLMNGEICGDIPREEWVLFEVNVVDKENLNILIDEKVIAKNREHAKGLTGVYDVLEDKNFDNTKLKIIVEYIASIRPVKEDE